MVFVRTVKSGLLALGMGLCIGGSASAAQPCGPSYVIAPGDTLAKIARRCNSTVDGIIAANDDIRNASRISVGQRIMIPGSAGQSDEVESGTLTGRITNGRWCALLETQDGQVYGLRSSKFAFTSGDFVVVTGKMVPGSSCRQDLSLVVTELTPTVPE